MGTRLMAAAPHFPESISGCCFGSGTATATHSWLTVGWPAVGNHICPDLWLEQPSYTILKQVPYCPSLFRMALQTTTTSTQNGLPLTVLEVASSSLHTWSWRKSLMVLQPVDSKAGIEPWWSRTYTLSHKTHACRRPHASSHARSLACHPSHSLT